MFGKKFLCSCFLILACAQILWGCGKAEESSKIVEETTKAVIEVTTKADEPASQEIPRENMDISLDNPQENGGDEGQQDDESLQNQEISLLFGGDVLLSDHVLNAYHQAGGIHGVLDDGYRQLIDGSDFFMVNEEFPFSSRGVQAEDKQFTFRLPPEKAPMFQEMGIDAVTLANNHALDFGQEALADTIAALDSLGIPHTGAGENLEEAARPVSVEIQGMKIGIIGATRVIPVADWAAGSGHPGMLATYDASYLLEKIKEMRTEYDYVIVFVHWGIERDEIPQDYQRTLGRQYIDAGADMVIGSHPHVLQGIEYYNQKPIVYSLGNFVFGSSIPKTALLKVSLSADGNPPVLQLFPGTSAAGFTRMLTDQNQRQEFFQYIENISFQAFVAADGTVTEKAALNSGGTNGGQQENIQ